MGLVSGDAVGQTRAAAAGSAHAGLRLSQFCRPFSDPTARGCHDPHYRFHVLAQLAQRGSRGKTASAGGFRRPLFTQDAEPRDVDVLTSLDRTFAKGALVGKPSRRASFGTTGLSGVVVRNGAMHAG
jgi:hypothetical protein